MKLSLPNAKAPGKANRAMKEFKVISADGRTAVVSAVSKVAARRKGRGELRLPGGSKVEVKRSLNLPRNFGGLKPGDQMEALMTYSRLLASRTPLESAYERLGKRVAPRRAGERASQAFERSGIHPVACAILSGAETAGHSGAGADRAADWLAAREQRMDEYINPVKKQFFFSAAILLILFAMPIIANAMFEQLPDEYVQLQHTVLSEFLVASYSLFYEPLTPFVALGVLWGGLMAAGLVLFQLKGQVRDRLPLLGPLGQIAEHERLTAWLSMYMPFHAANLPFSDFVHAGAHAFRSGPLAKAFAKLSSDVERGEADSLATAASVHPEVIPAGMHEAIVVMADMDLEAGQKHLSSLMMLSSREMRRLAVHASRQGGLMRTVSGVVIAAFMLVGIYGPLALSMGAPT